MIGSLTETTILNRLLQRPEARDAHVAEVMGEPFPVVPGTLPLEHLSAHLEQGGGAVLVQAADGSGYEIITKSDLISALAKAGRNGAQR